MSVQCIKSAKGVSSVKLLITFIHLHSAFISLFTTEVTIDGTLNVLVALLIKTIIVFFLKVIAK